MGANGAKLVMPPVPPLVQVPVTMHIYDLGTSGSGRALNTVLRPLGSGVVHCGVEVHGWEWSYNGIDGVFYCGPMKCTGHTYQDSYQMGGTPATRRELNRVIELLRRKW